MISFLSLDWDWVLIVASCSCHISDISTFNKVQQIRRRLLERKLGRVS